MLITVCSLYDSYADANRVVLLLEAAGLPPSETTLISNNSDTWYTFPVPTGSRSSCSYWLSDCFLSIGDPGTALPEEARPPTCRLRAHRDGTGATHDPALGEPSQLQRSNP